jgi:hypothetical protein
MRHTPLYVLLILLGWATVTHAQSPANEASPPNTPPASSPTASTTAEPEAELINQVLSLLGEAVVTRLDARVSLESLEVEQGHVRLTGVSLKNLNVCLRLNARGAQRLAQTLQQRAGKTSADAKRPLMQLFEILKLGLFNRLEINIHLDELNVRRIAINTEDLQIEGLLLQVGATPPDPVTGKPRSDTLQTLMEILRRTSLNRIKAEAGLDKLSAGRAHLDLDGIALTGFSVAVVLARQDNSAPPEQAVKGQ